MVILACVLASLHADPCRRQLSAGYVVNPSDLKRAYNFVVDHGKCLAHFQD